jgi:2'-5' RNA ligase
VPDALRALASGLNDWLRAGGFAVEEREYRPHVTLVRKARCAPIAESMPAVAWFAAEFVLVESRLETGGPQYRTLGRWPLG